MARVRFVGLFVLATLAAPSFSLAQPPAAGKRYALLVGVNEYNSAKLRKLDYAEKDVEAMAALLRENGYTVTLLRGKDATREKIGKALEAITKAKGKDDLLIFGLAGHGVLLDKKGSCFCPHDADFTDPATFLSMTDMLDRLGDCGAGAKLLLVDACREDAKRGIRGIDQIPQVPPGVGVLLSCSAGEFSFETKKLEHGVFFHHVLEGLRGKAKTEDNDVTWDQLRAYVKRRVPKDVETLIGGGGKQVPHEIGNLTTVPPLLHLAKGAVIAKVIDNGVAFLKKTQQPSGTWNSSHPVGYAALGGLTLLECSVPSADPTVQRATEFVRANVATLKSNYEISFAILFLDRLGDARDRPLIQGLALRLLAAQDMGGGWGYDCPQLNSNDMYQLYATLNANTPSAVLNPIARAPKKPAAAADPPRHANKPNDPFQQLSELIHKKAPLKAPLPSSLLTVPAVKHQNKSKGQIQKPNRSEADNSNTQFALMALWVARRHDVPSDHAIVFAYHRFMESQNADGGWGYNSGNASTNTMTNVGLLGLALGHGAAPELVNFNPKNPKNIVIKPALEDPTIRKGLQALSRYIGQPLANPDKANFPVENLFFLWSVERVAMLYDLKTVGGKNWYLWGSQILVHNQQASGEWPSAFYQGSAPPLNTCFALLFLRRSNLLPDLTNDLRIHAGIRAE